MTDYELECLVKSARRATIPWKGRFAKKRQKEYRQENSDERISKCLTCPFEDCVNCYSDKRSAFEILLKSGMNRASICNALSISEWTFFNYKKTLTQ